ncbi:MAG TPA: hypothetical protein VEF53_10245 [Patescibacteria group bacterium]|nr:hypothetical protein [Patescibacteria group bacterium]
MPNRIIKESVCISEDIDELSSEEETFFYRIIVNCDDFGRMDARTQIVRAKCYPLKTDSISLDTIDNWLLVLSKKLVTLYEVNNKRYLQVNTWDKHQNIRAKESKYPSMEEGNIICLHMISGANICNQMQSNVPVSRYSILDTRYSNNMSAPEGAGVTVTPAEKPELKGGAQNLKSGKGNYTEEFEEFWRNYPRQVVKSKAFKQWQARLKEKVKAEDLIVAAKRYSVECKTKKLEEQFIKHPATFLGSDKAYEDYFTDKPKLTSNKVLNKNNTFNNFEQRNYNHEEIEKLLIEKSRDELMSDEEFEQFRREQSKSKVNGETCI